MGRLLRRNTTPNLKIGFIGCGRMAEYHARVLRALGAGISAVCGRRDSNQVKAFAKRHGIPRVYDTWLELVRDHEVEALWVTTPWDVTGELLLSLIQTKLPLFIEKPVAIDSKRIQLAIQLQEKLGSKVVVGMNRRFYDFLPALRSALTTSSLKAVEVMLPEQVADGHLDPSQRNRLWLTSSIHEIDLIYHLLGPLKVLVVEPSGKALMDGVHGFHGLLVAERSRVPVHLVAPWGAPWNKAIRFFFQDQVVELCPIEEMRVFHGMKKHPATRRNPITRFQPSLVKRLEASAQYKPGLCNEDEATMNWMRQNRWMEGLANLQDAYEVTCLIETICSATGGTTSSISPAASLA